MNVDDQVKERPILFSPEMVQAILAGRKTQTRRIIKPQPCWDENQVKWVWDVKTKGRAAWGPEYHRPSMGALFGMQDACPYGRAGERLWVRETWQLLLARPVSWGAGEDDWDYDAEEADGIPKTEPIMGGSLLYLADGDKKRCNWWRPSIHMPRWASRINLEIIKVRVERLQDISESDAIGEGVMKNWIGDNCPPEYDGEWENYAYPDGYDCFPCDSARESFSTLWDSINAKRGFSWDVNPWVWVIEFKVLDGKQ